MTPILILAAGASARMRGRDKLLEPVGGVPLLRLVAERAVATGERVFVALPARDHPRAAVLDGQPVTILPVPDAGRGMSHSLKGAVALLPPCARFLILPADLPEILTQDIETVLQAVATDEVSLIWRAATEDGSPGHPILFDARLRPEFASLEGDSGGQPIVSAHRSRTRLVPLPGQRARLDLDTPEDWAAWRARTGL